MSARSAVDVDPAVGHGELDGRNADGKERRHSVPRMDRSPSQRQSASGHARRLRSRCRSGVQDPARGDDSRLLGSISRRRWDHARGDELSSIRTGRDGASLLSARRRHLAPELTFTRPRRPQSSARPVQYCRYYWAILPRLALQTPGSLGRCLRGRASELASGAAARRALDAELDAQTRAHEEAKQCLE